MGTIPSAFLIRLLPEVKKLMLQLANWTQVEDVVSRSAVIQVGVIDVGEKPVQDL
jgi:hypothetical protein